jgi:hypothetical protein
MRLGDGASSGVGNMPDEDRYRRHAKFCREQALLLNSSESERWDHLADDYERLAEGHRTLYPKQQQPKS